MWSNVRNPQRYAVPMYLRKYVWGLESQLETLSSDATLRSNPSTAAVPMRYAHAGARPEYTKETVL